MGQLHAQIKAPSSKAKGLTLAVDKFEHTPHKPPLTYNKSTRGLLFTG